MPHIAPCAPSDQVGTADGAVSGPDLIALARAISQTGRGFEIDADNRPGRWADVDQLADSGECFAVRPDASVLAIDADFEGLDSAEHAQREAALAQLLSVLAAHTLHPVVVASGRAQHRHIFVRLDNDPTAHAQIDRWCTTRGLDVRRQAIRPPLAPHRRGLPVMLQDLSIQQALTRLSTAAQPGAAGQVARALGVPRVSERMRRVLREGHHAGGYATASHGRMALATAAYATGLTQGWLSTVLHDPANALGATFRAKPLTWRQAEVQRLWLKAAQHVSASPGKDHKSVEQQHADWAQALNMVPWSSMAGATDRAVCEALLMLAQQRGMLRFAAALSEVALCAGVSRDTARRSLRRLCEQGWLSVDQAPTATCATVWRLRVPVQVAELQHGSPAAAAAVPTPETVDDLGADLARWAGGIGKQAARVLRAVASVRSCTTAELAQDLHMSVNAVRLQLRRLLAVALVQRTGDGHWSMGTTSPAQAADALGVAGTRTRQRQAYEQQRAARALLRVRWSQARARIHQAVASEDAQKLRDCSTALPPRVVRHMVAAASSASPPLPLRR